MGPPTRCRPRCCGLTGRLPSQRFLRSAHSHPSSAGLSSAPCIGHGPLRVTSGSEAEPVAPAISKTESHLSAHRGPEDRPATRPPQHPHPRISSCFGERHQLLQAPRSRCTPDPRLNRSTEGGATCSASLLAATERPPASAHTHGRPTPNARGCDCPAGTGRFRDCPRPVGQPADVPSGPVRNS